MRRLFVTTIVVLAVLGGGLEPLRAQGPARPDFSGRWRMEASLSDFAGGAAPRTRIDNVSQRDSVLTVDRITTTASSGAPQLHHYEYAIDGREHRNVIGSIEIRSTLQWEGDELVMTSVQRSATGEVTATDRWRLSAARDTLVIGRRFNSGGRDVTQRLVFLRESPAR